MKEMLWVIRERFIIWKNHPLQVLFLLGVPFLSIFIYFFAYSSGDGVADSLTIGIVDQDQSVYSEYFISSIDKRINVKEIDDQQESDKELAAQNTMVNLVIPANFSQKIRAGEAAELSLRTFQTGEVIDTVQTAVKTTYNEVLVFAGFAKKANEKAAADFLAETPTIEFKSFDQDSRGKSMSIQILGFMLMMLLYQAGNFGANTIQNERRNKIYHRLMTTPVSKTAYFGGTAIFAFSAMLFEVIFTVLLMTRVFRIGIGLPESQLIFILAIFGLVAVAWSTAIGVNSPSSGFASGVQSILFTVTSLLSGALIPSEVMPNIMQQIARITPQYWVLDTIKRLQSNASFSSILINIVVLLAFTLLFLSISTYGFAKKQSMEVFD